MTAREIDIPRTGDATVPPGSDIARARSPSARPGKPGRAGRAALQGVQEFNDLRSLQDE
jgi:hypothetical protein